jgi:hypothetical protein
MSDEKNARTLSALTRPPHTSLASRQRITDADALVSYARPDNPYDNAQAEAG